MRSPDPTSSPSARIAVDWPPPPQIEIPAETVTGPRLAPSFDEERVRALIPQIASALTYLHDRRQLHRDIKPSNVLVDRDGRLVLLDFGLVTELARGGDVHQTDALVGTPHYMAPESARGEASPASDWYSVGVILYKIFTGTLPHRGKPLEVMMAKQEVDAQPPSRINPAVPADLDELCAQLLSRDPARRPTGPAISGRFALRHRGGEGRGDVFRTPGKAAEFVGRASQLEALEQALERAQRGQTSVALVQGRSAMGKSALVWRFLHSLEERVPNALVLAGRCHPQESVSYKAFDAIVDSLTRFLARQTNEQAAAALPRNVSNLIRMFPVLGEVEMFSAAPLRDLPLEPAEQRRRAFAALRELFSRLSERRPVILFVDDIQWGDAESAALLTEILRPPDGPPLMLVAAYRSDEESSSPFLGSWLPSIRAEFGGRGLSEIPVGPLTVTEATLLAKSVMGDEAPRDNSGAIRIAREADGQPLFVSELAHYARERLTGQASQPFETAPEVSLDGFIRTRATLLPPSALELLKIVVVADQPVPREIAERASASGGDAFADWKILSAGRWLRTRQPGGDDLVEPYHDRVRESIASTLWPEERQKIHARLASAMEERGNADAETLATHLLGAGQLEKAGRFAEQAARAAEQVLAFDRAARLYRLALENKPADHPTRPALEQALGDALAMAARRADAADAYLKAAERLPAEQALELHRRAAQQLIMTGRIESGLGIIRRVLAKVGFGYPTSTGQTLLLVAWYGLLRSFRRRMRSKAPAPTPWEMLRLDTLHVATHFLGLVDPLRGMCFSRRHAWCALAVNDAARASRALASEIPYSALTGGEEPSPAENRMHEQARELAIQSQDPRALGFVELTASIAAVLRARWDAATTHLVAAENIFRGQKGTVWEVNVIAFYKTCILRFRGDWGELAASAADPLADARARGDVYAETQFLSVAGAVPHLLADDGEAALREVREGIARWGRPAFDQQKTQATVEMGASMLYRDGGRGVEAFDFLEAIHADLRRSGALFLALNRIVFHDVYGRACLAKANSAAEGEQRQALGRARAVAKKLEKENIRWGTAHALLLRAGANAIMGDKAGAMALLEQAETAFTTLHMGLHAASARWRRGQLAGGELGAGLVSESLAFLGSEGAKNPARLAASLVPGSPS